LQSSRFDYILSQSSYRYTIACNGHYAGSIAGYGAVPVFIRGQGITPSCPFGERPGLIIARGGGGLPSTPLPLGKKSGPWGVPLVGGGGGPQNQGLAGGTPSSLDFPDCHDPSSTVGDSNRRDGSTCEAGTAQPAKREGGRGYLPPPFKK